MVVSFKEKTCWVLERGTTATMEESVTTATTIMEEEEPPFNTEKESEDNIGVEAMG